MIDSLRKIFLGGVLALLLCSTLTVQAQTDYKNIKVENLSDEQVVRIITEAEKRGLNDDQLLYSLEQRGLSSGEQQKLRARMADVRKNVLQGKRANDIVEPTEEGRQVQTEVDLFQNKEEEVTQDNKTDGGIFGASLFRNSNIRFEPNLNMPTPAGYVIGSGDQLLLDLTGDNEASYRLPVSPEGTVRVEYVGIIPVAGLTIEDAADKIRTQMQRTYPGLRSGNTRLSLTLGNIRSIKVTLTGQVTKPGTYTLPSVANVFHALYAAGGPSAKGTYRNIQLIRNNQIIQTIDTYDFLTKGIQSGNVRLEDQDVIHIPVFTNHVSFEGLVKNPGIFEPATGETLEDLLRYAGGFDTKAYTAKIKVLQVTDRERSVADIYANEYSQYTPKNGDQYIVEEVLDRFANRVDIEGAVFRPGQYELTPGLTLRQLIDRADGLKEDAFMGRAYINRLKADNTQELISFDLDKLIAGEIEDYILRREDKVIISSIFDLRDEYSVSINGEVRRPGQFKFVEDMTLGSLIHMSGGLAEAANIEHIEVARRIRRNVNERDSVLSELHLVTFGSREEALNSDFVLQPYDIVSVRSSTGYQYQKQVRIEGEVKYPGVYTILSKDERISDLVRRAGGVTEYAYLEGASLQRKASDLKISQDHGALSQAARQEIEAQEAEQDRLRDMALQNTKEAEATSNLFFSNYVGIDLEKVLAGKSKRQDLILEDEDVIVIPKQLQTVTVRGQVLNPNRVVYKPGKPLAYYIDQAGGFTVKAHKKKTFVQYANGSVKGTRMFYPEVKPGAEIIVPTRPEREKLSAQSWIGIGTSVASMAAIVVSLLRK